MDRAQENATRERTAGGPSSPLDGGDGLASGAVHVAAAWIVSRAIAVAALVLGGSPTIDRLTFGWLNGWDAAWYLRIAQNGYIDEANRFGQTHWPFFPLLPLLTRALHIVGVPWKAAPVLIANAAFAVALAGMWRLAARHLDRRGTVLAVWALALFPTSITFAMGYPSALYLAAAVWAFILVEDRHHLGAGLCAAAATLARPNGFTVAVALAVAVWLASRRASGAAAPWRGLAAVTAPAAVAFGGWCALLWRWAGDPFIFWSAKAGWDEITVVEFATDPGWHGTARAAWPHILCGVVAMAALAATWRRLLVEWRVLAVLSLVPPLLTGVVGLGRYAADCFPVFLAFGLLLERAPRRVPAPALVLGAAGLAYFGVLVARYRFVP